MPRYIDTDALYELGHYDDFDEYVVDWKTIDNAPTADVIDVVRCKDCFYAIPYNERWTLPKKNNCMWCKRYEDVRIPEWFCADGFCADGERREDDGEQ